MAATPEHAARVLGLSLEATLEDVRSVRRKMALKYHPDRSNDKEQATRHMGRINAAADTLNAYIKNRARSGARRKAPSYQEFSAHKQAGQSSACSEKPNPQENSQTRKQDSAPSRKPNRPKASSRADSALIRLASESYASVLDRIGRKAAGSRIDVRILNFQGAH